MTKGNQGEEHGESLNLKAFLVHISSTGPPLGALRTPLHDAAARSAGSTRALLSVEDVKSRAAGRIRRHSPEGAEGSGEW